jgi:hypothetical protein
MPPHRCALIAEKLAVQRIRQVCPSIKPLSAIRPPVVFACKMFRPRGVCIAASTYYGAMIDKKVIPRFTLRRDYVKTRWSDGVVKNPKSQAPNNK